MLPLRFDGRTGKNVYSQDAVLTVKRLRAEGIAATFLDDSDARVFESLNSAEAIAGALLLGIATNVAYDALKLVVHRLRRRRGPDAPVRIQITDATDSTPAEWTVSGSSSDVLKMLDELKVRGVLPSAHQNSEAVDAAPTTPVETSDRVAHTVRERLAAAEQLRAEAQAMLDAEPANIECAETKAVEALAAYRSALDWAEDTDRREEMHLRLDAAGRWRREQFGCAVEYSDGKYWETCPVALGHHRVGLSAGGLAYRACSICGGDFTECEHDPDRTYLVAGGTAVANCCRVCASSDCKDHKTHLLYRATPISVITEMHVDEISFVSRPAFKDARIDRRELLTRELPLVGGRPAPSGAPLTCNKCMTDCHGLVEMLRKR